MFKASLSLSLSTLFPHKIFCHLIYIVFFPHYCLNLSSYRVFHNNHPKITAFIAHNYGKP